MKKTVIFLVLFALVFAVLPISSVKAAVPVNYESSIQIRNLTSTPGTITITFYDLTGTLVATVPDTIAGDETKSYYQSTMPIAAGFNGSVVVSSSVQTAGMSNLVGLGATSNRVSYAAFSAFDAGSTTVFLPTLFYQNYSYNTFFYVQNLGPSDADVIIAYSDGTTASLTGIKPYASQIVKQITENHPVAVFSATLTATQPIAVTVVEEGLTLFAYDGFGAGATMPIMPLINENNYGYFTGVQIQNAGTVATTVTVSYTPSMSGTACTETRQIAPGASKTFAQNVFYNAGAADPSLVTNCSMGPTFIGSGEVTVNSAGQPLVSVVNQLQIADNKGGAYGAFSSAMGTGKLIFPLIMDRNYGYFTSWSIVNVGAAIPGGGISCAVTGKDSGGNPIVMTFTNPEALAPKASWTMNHLNMIANGFVGGATCTASGASIIGSSNQLGAGAMWAGVDTLLVSEGFSVALYQLQ